MAIHVPVDSRREPSPCLDVAAYHRVEISGVWCAPIETVAEVIQKALHRKKLCSCFGKAECDVRWYQGDDLDLDVLLSGDETGIRRFSKAAVDL